MRNRFGRRSETRRAFTNDGLGIDTGLTFAIGRHLEVARRKAGGLISESAGQIHRRCPAEDFRSVSGQPRKNEDMPVGVGLDVSHINFGSLRNYFCVADASARRDVVALLVFLGG